MDPLSIANGALSMVEMFASAAEKVWGTPDWIKYAQAGLSICRAAIPIVQECTENPSKYDSMTPADIQKLLAPDAWEDLLLLAKARETAA